MRVSRNRSAEALRHPKNNSPPKNAPLLKTDALLKADALCKNRCANKTLRYAKPVMPALMKA
jgi:hypothetical protein